MASSRLTSIGNATKQFIRRYATRNQVVEAEQQLPEVSGIDPFKETPLWKRLYYFAFIPMSILVTYNAQYVMDHSHPRPPFYKYDHLRIRNKQFPWPDSNRSLIHSKKHNALPDGYEDYDATAH